VRSFERNWIASPHNSPKASEMKGFLLGSKV
jgi:hypothetical protein